MRKTTLRNSLLLALALGSFAFLGTAGTVRADDWRDRCAQRINHEQFELDHAIARHGYRSREAEHERRELDRLRYECGYRGR
ncbi:MAG: hypothetical protein WCA00_11450 [Candidatus Acidiferrales bacterium]